MADSVDIVLEALFLHTLEGYRPRALGTVIFMREVRPYLSSADRETPPNREVYCAGAMGVGT